MTYEGQVQRVVEEDGVGGERNLVEVSGVVGQEHV